MGTNLAAGTVDRSKAELFDVESRELETFVGPRARYYLRVWQPLRRGVDGTGAAHWPAFVFSTLWLPFRKMYRLTAIFFGLLLIELLAEELILLRLLGWAEVPQVISLGTVLGLAIACGAYGNRWYLEHARRAVSQADVEGLSGEARQRRIAELGGTSLPAVLVSMLLFMAATLVLLVALEHFFPIAA